MDTLIKAQHITVIRNKTSILNSVSVSIESQDFITIIGPNGAGKSMLLKCLMGFYSPNKGTIIRKKNLKIGYVPQRFVPDATLPITVQRFLTLRKKAEGMRMQETAEETGISSLLNKPLYTLSGGEMQRVLLARSLLDNPELLVLDEPAQNLDISGQLAFYKLLECVYTQHKLSIVMVSHDLHMVMASTKHVLCLFHHVCCSGEPFAVTQDPEFIALFGSDMAHMMAVYQHNHHETHNGTDHE